MPRKILQGRYPCEYVHISGHKAELEDNAVVFMFLAVDNYSYFGLDAKVYDSDHIDNYLSFMRGLLHKEELQSHLAKAAKITLVMDISNRYTAKLQKAAPKKVKIICDKKLARSVTNKLAKEIFKR